MRKDIFYLHLLHECQSADQERRLKALEDLRKHEYLDLVEAQFLRRGVAEGVRAKAVFAIEFVKCAVILLPATLCVDGDHYAGVAAVFSIVVSRLHFELAYRIQAQLRVLAIIRTDIGVDGAIQKHVIRAAAHTVHVHLVGIVKLQLEIRTIVGDDSRKSFHQRLEVATIHLRFQDLFRIDDAGVV